MRTAARAPAVECLRGAWGGQSAAQGDLIGGVGCPAPSPLLVVNWLGYVHPVLKVGAQQLQRGPQISSHSPCCRARAWEERRPEARDYWVGPEAPGTDPAGSQGSSTLALPRTTSGGSVLLGPPGPAGPALGPSPASLLQTVPNGLKRMLRARSVHGRTAGHPGSQLPLLPRAARGHRKRSRASRGWSQEGGGGQWWDQQPPSMGGLPWSSEGCGSRPRVPEERGGAEG